MNLLKFYLTGLWIFTAVTVIQAQSHDSNSSFSNTGNCQAAWSAALDTLSPLPYFYDFKDKSTGNINSWTWDFGDGTASSMQNPAHKYDMPGTFNVCLTVADINNPDSCYDQYCQEITTPEYYSLGGLVFAGEYPLNNPVPEGDTGIAYLYRAIGDQVAYIEEHTFSEYGYYGFGFLLPGRYLVKIGLTPGSVNYDSYFTTYLGDGVKWQNARPISISDSSNYSAEIHLYPTDLDISGPGIIRGSVNFEQGVESSIISASEITVILSDYMQKPIKFAIPSSSGYFEFSGLPFGTYFLSADATGKPSTNVTISLSDNNPVADNIHLTIFGSNIQGVHEDYPLGFSVSDFFPNPVRDELFVQINSAVNTRMDICVSDISGREFLSKTVKITPGQSKLCIQVSHLPKGLYIIRMQAESYFTNVTRKFVK